MCEWVQDGWEATYYRQFQDKPAINPNRPFSAGSERVFRGGSWLFLASYSRSSFRFAHDPAIRYSFIGFRAALTVDGVKAALALLPERPQQVVPSPPAGSVSAADPKPDVPGTYTNGLGMKFVPVPKGTAWLGGGGGKQGETKVVIEQDFFLGKYEVTQEDWENVTGGLTGG